jgi:hypothetical protein
MKTVKMERRHFEVIAGIIKGLDRETRHFAAPHFAEELAATNPNFDADRFLAACGVEPGMTAIAK